MANELLLRFVFMLASQLPVLIAILVCIGLVVRKQVRASGVKFIALAGLLILLIQIPLVALVYSFGIQLLARDIGYYRAVSLVGVIYDLTLAIGFGALVIAVFMKRKNQVEKFG